LNKRFISLPNLIFQIYPSKIPNTYLFAILNKNDGTFDKLSV